MKKEKEIEGIHYFIRRCPICGKRLRNYLTWYNANIPCEECAKKRNNPTKETNKTYEEREEN